MLSFLFFWGDEAQVEGAKPWELRAKPDEKNGGGEGFGEETRWAHPQKMSIEL